VLRNEGEDAHHAQFLRLKDGVTYDQLGAAFQQGPDTALALVDLAGGPGTTSPGQSSNEVFLNLQAGNYVMVCFVSDEDNVPHLAKGMIAPFQVSPPPSTAAAPQATAQVRLFDFGFTIPQLRSGQQTLQLTNQGPQPHELDLVKIPDDVTPDQVAAAIQNEDQGPPPFDIQQVPGMQAFDAGQSTWLSLNLAPGQYVAMCHVPDPATGKDHASLGMVSVFRVQ
jgi:hypothetical protein